MQKGYTLIEMVVAVAIVILLSMGAVTAYLNFRDRRQALSDVREVVDYLRKVKTKVTAVEVPTGLSGVTNYTVTFGANSVSTVVNATTGGPFSMDGLTFDSSTFIAPLPTLVFEARTGVLKSGATTTVSFCGGGKHRYSITITKDGSVTGPTFVAATCT